MDKGQKFFFPGVLLMFLQQFASKTIFLAYIRLLAILGGSRRGSDKAEALEEVFGCLDAHSQTEVDELEVCGVDQAIDLAQLKWSRVGEVQKGASPAKSGCLASSDLFGSTTWRKGWKTMTTFPNICSLLDYN